MLCWTLHLKRQERHHQPAVALGHMVYTCGGDCRGWTVYQMSIHAFNTVSLRWKKLQPVKTGRRKDPLVVPPTKRHGHTAVLMGDGIYIWGGVKYMGGSCNELYTFDVDTQRWSMPTVSGTVPEKRVGHSASVLGKVMYIYGGYTTEYTNEIYKLDAATMVWSSISTRGTLARACSRHSATIIGTKMFVFGGQGDQGTHYNNIRVFDTATNCWLSTPSARFLPEQHLCHSAFTYNGELYIFGAYNVPESPLDLWKFNLESLSWKRVAPKGEGPRSKRMSRVCCCMVGKTIVVILSSEEEDDSLYILDLHPSLKALCKRAVIQYELEQTGLPHNVGWELAAMTNQQKKITPRKKEKVAEVAAAEIGDGRLAFPELEQEEIEKYMADKYVRLADQNVH